jgi:Rrf2 family protein
MSGFFRVTARDHSGLILMTALAERYSSEVYLSLQDVAADMQLSQGYLEEVAASLKKAGLIAGKQGPSGGYRLAKAPADITLEDIVTALEGPVALVDCQSSPIPCPVEGKCSSKRVWHVLQGHIQHALRGMTLDSLIA